MTDDDAGRQARRNANPRPLPTSSRSYDGLLTYLGVRLYQERNRRRREQERAAEQERPAGDERGENDADR